MSLRISGRLEGHELPDPGHVVPMELDRAITEATMFLEREVKLRTPIGVTGIARGSIGSEIQRGSVALRGRRVTRGIVGSPQVHVAVLDRGRRPGGKMPPLPGLELWVRRIMGVKDTDESKRVAYLVGRKIARDGTEAVEMFDRAVDENEGRLNRILFKAGARISTRIARSGT